MESEGIFVTERLEVLPWGGIFSAKDDDSNGHAKEVLFDELSKILEEDVTALLPPSL